MRNIVLINLLLVLIISPLFGFAQTIDSIKSTTLKEVMIVDTIKRSPIKKESSSRIDNTMIEKIETVSVGDLAKFIAGVNVKDYGGIGGLKTISVRGLGSNHSAVIYDGIGVTDFQTGQVDLSKFSSTNIKEINLYNGQSYSHLQPARALASSNAFFIETLKPSFDSSERFKTILKTSYGSFNYANLGVNSAFKINNIWTSVLDLDINNTSGNYPYLLHYGNNENDSTSKEIRKNSDYFGFRGEWNLFGSFNAKSDIKLKAYYFYSERGLPMSTTLYYLNSGQRLWDENFFLQSIFTHKFSDKLQYRNHLKALYSYTHYYDSKALTSLGYQSDEYFQREYYMNNVVSYSIFKDFSTSLSNDVFLNNLSSPNIFVRTARRVSSLSALSLLYDNSKLLINGNILHTLVEDKSDLSSTSQIKNHFSPFISFGYSFQNTLTISLFYKDIFRMPTFNDLYFNKVSESKLRPEITKQFNLHIEYLRSLGFYKTSSINVSLDIYHNRVKDKIVAVPQRNLFIWSVINYGQVNINGIDLQTMFKAYISHSIDLIIRGTYSYQRVVDASNKESVTYGNQIPYTPLHSGTLFLNLSHPFIDFSYTLSFVGSRYSLPENIERNLLKPYQDHSISISKDFNFKKQKINLGLSCLNLLGDNYEVVINYPMPQRQFRINIKIYL
ncbi:MAG TPA: TonB-dependent receptor [Bacteroidales bacterium]|nr:TonB-dependent receptor [Bacteroidales bacterium]